MKRAASGGFTLLEIAVALAVLGVGVVTCLQIFSGSIRLQGRASRESGAVREARAAMDALIRPPEVADGCQERSTAEGYRTKWCVEHWRGEGGRKKEFTTESDFSLRRLQVDVTWQDGVGFKTYTLKSLRGAPEDND